MSCELFVGNLNPAVRTRDLENVFSRYGRIVRCDLKKNFGFIQFEDRRDAEEAIRKEDNRRLLGSEMTVEWAKGSVGDKPSYRSGGSRYVSGGRSPPGRGGRDRSPMGRNGFGGPGGRDRENRYQGGGGRRSFGGGRDSFSSNPRYDNDRRDGDRDRFQSRGPPRNNGYSDDRPPRGDRMGDRRDSFSGRPRRY